MFAFFQALFDTFINALIALLPISPFQSFISSFSGLDYLGYLNWFFPVGTCLQIGAAWLVSVAAFYIIMAALRWAKVVGE